MSTSFSPMKPSILIPRSKQSLNSGQKQWQLSGGNSMTVQLKILLLHKNLFPPQPIVRSLSSPPSLCISSIKSAHVIEGSAENSIDQSTDTILTKSIIAQKCIILQVVFPTSRKSSLRRLSKSLSQIIPIRLSYPNQKIRKHSLHSIQPKNQTLSYPISTINNPK